MLFSSARIVLVIVTCVITALITLAITNQTTYAGSGYDNHVDARIIGIAKQGQPTDRIPVIIQLQPQSAMPIGRFSITQKTTYLAQIAQQQQQFIQQNRSLLAGIKGTTKTTATIFATVLRSNLVMLASQKQLIGVEIDEPHPLELYESGETIGSRSAVLSGYDGTGTSVAILDTGVAKNHIFLAGQVVAEACFSSNITTASATSYSLCPAGATTSTAVDSGLPCPMTLSGCGHGTHVAGIIAGKRMNPPMNTTWQDSTGQNHTSELFGVAPGTKIIAVKVFSRFAPAACGSTTTECVMSWTSDQIAALDWLYNNYTTPNWGTLAAVNMSLGGGLFTGFCDTLSIKRPIDMLRSVGIATIIASGNGGYTNGISAPACISSAIAVGASQGNKSGQTPDTVTFFSNAPLLSSNQPNSNGDQLLDLMAPGSRIVSSYSSTNEAFVSMSGTSMATPHIVGAWAILKGIHPSASVSTLLRWFRDTGVAIDANTSTTIQLPVARANVQAAVDWALQPGTLATLTAQRDATLVVVQTQTAVRYATQTKAVELTQTQAAVSTATQANLQTATMAVRMTQTTVAQPTRTYIAQLTQTSGAERTATTAWQRTATAAINQTNTAITYITATIVRQQTQTAVAVNATATSDARTATAMVVNPTNTAIMAATRTAVVAATQTAGAERTATTAWQRTATADARTATAMVVNPTNTAIMAATRTAVVAATQTAGAERTATTAWQRTATADARTATAMVVNPTNTAIMAATRTAVMAATQTAGAERTATTAWQRTATAEINQTNTTIANSTATAARMRTQTAVAMNATATSDARTATAMVVNPTNTAIMAATRTAVMAVTQTAGAERTATSAWQRTATAEINQTNTTVANSTATIVRQQTQTAVAVNATATSDARTATAMVVNTTNTALVAATRTAVVAANQTTVAQRTALVVAQRTATPTPTLTK